MEAALLRKLMFPEPAPALHGVQVSACRHGQMIYLPNDMYIGGSLDIYGEYNKAEADMLMSLCVPGDVVVEVGANIGTHTVPLARHVGEAGRVLAFEPQRIIYQMLCGNLAINGLWNVIAERIALGQEMGVASIPAVNYSAPGNFGAVELVPLGGEPVQVLRLDDYKLVKCNLLKIDVEGMELDVLLGAQETVKRHRPVIYCENDRPGKAHSLVGHLRGAGYDLYWHLPPLYAPDNFRGEQKNVFTNGEYNVVSINMLCLPHERDLPVPDSVQPVERGGELE